MNSELVEYKINSIEKGLEATNDNLRNFVDVSRLQSESIVELKNSMQSIKEKAEFLHQSVRDLAHIEKGTQKITQTLLDETDKKLKSLKDRLSVLETEKIKNEVKKGIWKFLFDKIHIFSWIFMVLFLIVASVDTEMMKNNIQKLSEIVNK